ncbi:MAG: Holliday junction resolvase RuvX [Clostridiales bacterium]|jgi:putative Holliday junction resolvase|nr:Holliday junction resolvase RuvX [Clostridiales bacterium]
MKIMAVDFGDSRTGLAVCDKMELLASPLCVVEEKDFDNCILKVSELVKENKIEKIIVGYPVNMNGTVGERADRCKLFADTLAEKVGIPVEMWDERCTTVSAHNYLNQTNTRGKKRKAIIDAVAATIILENYLEYRKNINQI